ncbi:hypothetical protein LS71_002610 [Helicobacter jaachi]|uniref:Uncharacterized protein n=1 Tax=Helicobacter jaachi TaxID=1677920 RepID=A0A4U8TCF2_9HELI|nr:hypothetical protein [Helicobacter jaachi]TLD97650.1 hypothetical protein LS71_002610 [Helicobacter jaachi]
MILTARHKENGRGFSVIVSYTDRKIDLRELKKIFALKHKERNLEAGAYAMVLEKSCGDIVCKLDACEFYLQDTPMLC